MLVVGTVITNAQTADEIIQKHIKAIGGSENWKKIKSLKMSGTVKAGDKEFPVTITTLNGKGQKVEFTLDGKQGYEVLTTSAGWAFNPADGESKIESMPAEMVKGSQDQLDIQGPLIDYKAKGNKVEFTGKEQIAGADCYKLKVTNKNGKEETMYINASTYYHVRSVEKVKGEGGKEGEAISDYSNYQKLPEGIAFPMFVESDGGPVTFQSIKINIPVDESIFKKPAGLDKSAGK